MTAQPLEVEVGPRIAGILRVAIAQPGKLGAYLVAEPGSVRAVDLDQVASRVSDVELDLAARQLVQVPAHRVPIVRPPGAGLAIGGLEVVDLEAKWWYVGAAALRSNRWI